MWVCEGGEASLLRQLKQQVLSKCAAIREVAPHTPPAPAAPPRAAAAAFAFFVVLSRIFDAFLLLFWLTNYVNVEIN